MTPQSRLNITFIRVIYDITGGDREVGCKVCTTLMKVTFDAVGHILNPHIKAAYGRTSTCLELIDFPLLLTGITKIFV